MRLIPVVDLTYEINELNQTFHLLHSELLKLGVSGDPEGGGDGGHDQSHHGDLPGRSALR